MGAYLGHHHFQNRPFQLEPHSLHALLKQTRRAGLALPCHWHPLAGLLLVLAFSRYVAWFTLVIVRVDIHVCPHQILLHVHSFTHTFTFSFLHCTERWAFLLSFYCLLFFEFLP